MALFFVLYFSYNNYLLLFYRTIKLPIFVFTLLFYN